MTAKAFLVGTTIVLTSWFALGPVKTARSVSVPLVQLAQNEQNQKYQEQRHRSDQDNDWYQGQRGHWDKDKNQKWQWRGAQGDQWYQGQQGHWYDLGSGWQGNGWQFQSNGLICNPQGRNCRRGAYLPPNGEGMVSRQNPRFYWACDSEGHNCHWAKRPGY